MSDTKGHSALTHKLGKEVQDVLTGDYYNNAGERAELPTRDWSVDEERKAKRK
jgi:hypothetical protein